MLSKRVQGVSFVCLALGFVLIVVALLPQVAGVDISITNSDCLTVKYSEYGVPICWRKPSLEFQRIINAEAYKLGYDVQPDGTYRKVLSND